MVQKITRRTFIKGGAALGMAASMGAGACSNAEEKARPLYRADGIIDMAVATGDDYFAGTREAIRLLGGMSRFVPENSKVLLLGNVWRIPGTFTKPGIFRAVARMCREAGAAEVNCVSMMPDRNWRITGNRAALESEGASLNLFNYKEYSRFRRVPVPNGIALEEAELIEEFFTHDVFINIPICKHHVDTVFSCTMKNLMGLNSYRNNRIFHVEEIGLELEAMPYLAQCIADLNTVIAPTLNVVDATEFIATNGPMGPGRVIKPRKIVAGTDRIALDAYCIALLDRTPGDVIKIRKGYEHGLGEMDLSKVGVREVTL